MIKRPTPTKPLRERRIRFCKEYVLDFNGTQAAIRAGYSEHTADIIANELLKDPRCIKLIQIEKDNYQRKYEIRKEFIVEKLFTLIQQSETDSDRATLIKSLDMLNKMAGNYSSTVTNINIEQELFPDVQVKDIPTVGFIMTNEGKSNDFLKQNDGVQEDDSSQ